MIILKTLKYPAGNTKKKTQNIYPLIQVSMGYVIDKKKVIYGAELLL